MNSDVGYDAHEITTSMFFIYIYSAYTKYQSKVWVFLHFHYFLHCRIIVKTSQLWNHAVTKKVLNITYILIGLRLFRVATLCLNDSFTHSWHSLNQSWRSSHICGALVGYISFTLRFNSSQTISIVLRLGDCGGQVIWGSTPSPSLVK